MKKIRMISILVMMITIMTTTVLAANDSYQTTLKTNAKELKQGETLTITIGLDKIAIESGEKGIGAYSGKLQYDNSILEYVKTEGTDNWEAPFFQNGLMTGNTKDGNCVNQTQDIGKITFKIKEDAKVGETTVKLTNFLGSMGEVGDLEADNQEIKISILDSKKEENNNNNNNNENNNTTDNNNNESNNTTDNTNKENNNNKNDTVKNQQSNSNIDNSTSGGKLPQTGENNSMIFATITMLVIVSVISFVRYQKLIKKI